MLEFLRRDAGGSNDLSEASSQLLIVIKEGCRNDGAVAEGPVMALGIVSEDNEKNNLLVSR
jgi:hypothetical protein